MSNVFLLIIIFHALNLFAALHTIVFKKKNLDSFFIPENDSWKAVLWKYE